MQRLFKFLLFFAVIFVSIFALGSCDILDQFVSSNGKIVTNDDSVHEHVYDVVFTEPTCTSPGYARHTCDCGDSYTEEVGGPIPHNHMPTFVEPTCTENGYVIYTCDCGDSYIEDGPYATGHHIIYHDAKAATCVEIGWDTYMTCSRCDYNTYVEISDGPHSFDYGYCVLCGISADYTIDLSYRSNGDGTCYVSTGVYCQDKDIIIPPVSPDGETVTGIGQSAFNGNSFVRSIRIPDTVTSIGSLAFYNCISLTHIHLGKGVENISSPAFASSVNLLNITVDEENPYYKSIDGNLYTKNGSSLLQYAVGKTDTSFTVPEHVTSIEDCAFYKCQSLQYVTLPDCITKVGVRLFEDCENLRKINIPKSLTHLSDFMFASCVNLENVVIPDSITYIGNWTFSGCDGFTDIVIPNSVTFIDWYAFLGCEYITEIIIPDSVTTMSMGAFSYCTALESVTISKGLTKISREAFMGCLSLTTVTIPESVTLIEKDAFRRCENLKIIVLPAGLKEIQQDAFWECGRLEIMYNTGSVEDYLKVEGNGYNHVNIDFFYSEEAPTTHGRFWHYVNGEIVIWPGSEPNYSIGLDYQMNYTLNCYEISGIGTCTDTNIIIPATYKGMPVMGIRENAFLNCTGITSVTIPNSVISIGEYAFSGCSGIKTITYRGTMEKWEAVTKGTGWDAGIDTYAICYNDD